MSSLGFLACIEAGVLERQAILLFQSIRSHAGEFASCPIYAYSPRPERNVSEHARRRMRDLGVTHVDCQLNTHGMQYGTVNRIVAGAHAETNFNLDFICVVDSDSIFVGAPVAFNLMDEFDMLARPVDLKGCCSAGPHDPYDAYLREISDLCGISYDRIPYVTATIDGARVKASYNGGLVIVRSEVGILRRTADLFFASAKKNLTPRSDATRLRTGTGIVNAEQAKWWGSSQISLALSAWSLTDRVGILDSSYNYPLHLHRKAPNEIKKIAWRRAKHIHYHWLLHVKREWRNPLFRSGTPLTEGQQHWLKTSPEVNLY